MFSEKKGKTNQERMERHAYEALQRESEEHVYWEQLASINDPLFVIRGGKEGAVLSEAAAFYQKHVKHCEVKVLEASDHNLYEPSIDEFVELVRELSEGIGKEFLQSKDTES